MKKYAVLSVMFVVFAQINAIGAWASDLRCELDAARSASKWPSADEYILSLDEHGEPGEIQVQLNSGAWKLGSMEAVNNEPNKYEVKWQRGGANTFWYYNDTKELKQYNAATGDDYWNCD